MTIYADQPARRYRQVLGDVLVAGWILGCVLLGRATHALVSRAAAPAERLRDAGLAVEDGMTEAGGVVGGVPLLGENLARPFVEVASSGRELAGAGQGFVDTVADLALAGGLAVALVPALVVAVPWVLLRWRYARHARVVRRLSASAGGRDLLALRALAGVPLAVVRDGVGDDAAARWRAGDPEVADALAGLELDRWGLRAG